jgi:hypothetical protein
MARTVPVERLVRVVRTAVQYTLVFPQRSHWLMSRSAKIIPVRVVMAALPSHLVVAADMVVVVGMVAEFHSITEPWPLMTATFGKIMPVLPVPVEPEHPEIQEEVGVVVDMGLLQGMAVQSICMAEQWPSWTPISRIMAPDLVVMVEMVLPVVPVQPRVEREVKGGSVAPLGMAGRVARSIQNQPLSLKTVLLQEIIPETPDREALEVRVAMVGLAGMAIQLQPEAMVVMVVPAVRL